MLLIDYFERTAQAAPERLFLHFVGEEPAEDAQVTYGEANREASRFAAALRSHGVALGDRVAIMAPNSPHWLLWHFANQKIGAATLTLNPDLLPAELEGLVASAKLKAIVSTGALREKAEGLASKLGGIRLLDETTGGPLGGSTSAPDVGVTARDPAIPDDADLSVVFTSGTTGSRSKGVIMPVANVVQFVGAYGRPLHMSERDRIMLVTPLFHAAALHWGTGLAVLFGGSLVIADRFRKTAFWRQAERAGATVVWTMAAVPLILLTQPRDEAEAAAMKRLRVIFGNGAAARAREITARWGPIFWDGFGMSEAFGTLTEADSFATGEPYPCAGRPVEGLELRIQDPETGAFLAARQEGEILARHGQGFREYLNDPEATAQAVRAGWFRTGDIGYFDESGRLFFVDRLKEIIRRGGKNISAKEVENVLLDHPDIAEAAAIAKDDAILGESVLAVLVPKEPGRVFGEAEIKAWCESRLAKYKLPESVATVSAELLPRTPTGKIKKLILRQQLRSQSGAFAK